MRPVRDSAATVAVVIVNWNGSSDTLSVLRELEKVDGPPQRRIVVDNGSTDNSIEQLEA